MVLGIFVVLAGQKTAYHIYKTIINIINTLLSTFKREHQKKKLIKYENLRIGREVLIKAYIFSIMKYVLTIIRFIFFTKAFNLNIPILVLIFGTPLGQIAYMFSFTPGGIGIFEAGWYGVLKYSGVDSQTGAMFVIGQRFLTIILVGACAFTSNIIQSIRKTKVDDLTNTLGTKE
jgi:uncharacterized protein (TIRG00374 family)